MPTDHGEPNAGWLRDAEEQQCEYCGEVKPCRNEPFGQKPACWTCWAQICFGEDD